MAPETGNPEQGDLYVRGSGEPGGGGPLPSETQKKADRALVVWIAAHPRLVLWVIIAALLPYLLVCWGVALTVAQALSVGCGG